MVSKSSNLGHISPDNILKNPDNPRLIFREGEMNQLLESIREVGIKVPISVYSEGKKYVIIDGERRWRCSLKLNLKDIPAIIQPKPTRLENLLMMFNIHNVRVQWDLMPTAIKLRELKIMLEKEGEIVSNRSLSTVTGLSLSTVARCMELLELPKKYKDMLIKESEKPKSEQVIKPDLFLEIIKSKKAVQKYVPEVFEKVDKNSYLDLMVNKYLKGVINNVVKFREISRIARSEEKGVKREIISRSIIKLAKDDNYSIDLAYKETAELSYKMRDLKTKINGLVISLKEIKNSDFSKDIIELLKDLYEIIKQVIGK